MVVCLHVSHVIDWRPVKGVSHLLPNVKLGLAPAHMTLFRISSIDGCTVVTVVCCLGSAKSKIVDNYLFWLQSTRVFFIVICAKIWQDVVHKWWEHKLPFLFYVHLSGIAL